MPSHDLKTRLVVAATAALGLTAGCASQDAEPAAAPSIAQDDEAPAEETAGSAEPPPAAEAEPEPDPIELEESAEDSVVQAPADDSAAAETPAAATPTRRELRRARPAPTPARPRSGASEIDDAFQASPAPRQEVTCGASCGADCGGVPGDEEAEE